MGRADGLTRFCAAASALGVVIRAVRYPEETRTAVDAATAIGCDVAQIVKSLVFATADGPVLALTSGANRVDTRALGEVVGTTIERADAESARAATGYSIGGTPPFGHPTPVLTFVDRDLLGHDVVWAAAGTPDSVFPIAPDRLVEVTGGMVADFASQAG